MPLPMRLNEGIPLPTVLAQRQFLPNRRQKLHLWAGMPRFFGLFLNGFRCGPKDATSVSKKKLILRLASPGPWLAHASWDLGYAFLESRSQFALPR